jgi:hypothetical protein
LFQNLLCFETSLGFVTRDTRLFRDSFDFGGGFGKAAQSLFFPLVGGFSHVEGLGRPL